MPANPPKPIRGPSPSKPSVAGVDRVVLTQMVTCGVLGWAIFAVAVERWLPTPSAGTLRQSQTVAQQASATTAGSVVVKSAQFQVSERETTR
jgi:hypothetical protein